MRFIDSAAVREAIDCPAIRQPAMVQHEFVAVNSDDSEQNIVLTIAEPESAPSGVLIAPVAWSDYGRRPFQTLRLGALAASSGQRVVCLDFPGMGVDGAASGSQLTALQAYQAQQGRFSALAESYWQALSEVDALKAADDSLLSVELLGNSLSTLTVTEMAAKVPEDIQITRLTLSEPMALQQRSPLALTTSFLVRGGRDLGKYSAMNKGLPEHQSTGLAKLVVQAVTQPESHRLAMLALARGKQNEILAEAAGEGRLRFGSNESHATETRVLVAEKGLVPRSADLTLGGLATRQHVMLSGECHGYQDSLPAFLVAVHL